MRVGSGVFLVFVVVRVRVLLDDVNDNFFVFFVFEDIVLLLLSIVLGIFIYTLRVLDFDLGVNSRVIFILFVGGGGVFIVDFIMGYVRFMGFLGFLGGFVYELELEVRDGGLLLRISYFRLRVVV